MVIHEWSNVGLTEVDQTFTANRIYLVPLMPAEDMEVAQFSMTVLSVAAVGARAALALYRGSVHSYKREMNEGLFGDANNPGMIWGLELVSRGPAQIVGLAATPLRYTPWRAPIVGPNTGHMLAFMHDNADVRARGGVNNSVQMAGYQGPTGVILGEFPAKLSAGQGANVPVPCVTLRTAFGARRNGR